MQKVYGAKAAQDGIVRVGRAKYDLFYGFGTDDQNEDNGGWNWRHRFDHWPTLAEVREVIFGVIDARVQDTILQGLSYEDALVWLSADNQRTYSLTAMSVQSDPKGALPVTVKLGTDEQPVWRTFEEATAFMAFFNTITAHINRAREEGWQEKKNINWAAYEQPQNKQGENKNE